MLSKNADRMRHRIGIVNDDPAMRDSMRALLEGQDFEISEYETADACLQKPDGYCVLLVDLALPGISGLELVEILRSGGIETPAVLMIDFVDKITAARIRAAKNCASLNKPIEPSELVQAIRRFCAEKICHHLPYAIPRTR